MDFEVSVKSHPDEPSEQWSLQANGHICIGRGEDCAIRLRDEGFVSRRHAWVTATRAGLLVRDVSTNGTLAGDELLRHTSREVPDGTLIAVADHQIVIRPRRERGAASDVRGASGWGPGEAPVGPALAALRPAPAAPLPASASRQRREQSVAATPAPGERGSGRGDFDEAELRREIHRQLIGHLDLNSIQKERLDDPTFRPRVLTALRRIVGALVGRLPRDLDTSRLIGEMADEALGLGPLEALLADDTVTEIMVVNAEKVYVERNGCLELSAARFTDEDRLRAVIERILTPLGRRIDESSPLVDARLADGSRVNAIIKPLAIGGAALTIRKFARERLDMGTLLQFGAFDQRIARFLRRCVVARKNIVISGGTGSGKTTLLNALSGAIPSRERIVTIEDSAELCLLQPHVVSLEARPANAEGQGAYSIRDLVRNALRMRPDRIVIGECRGAEAFDMLQAMNTGHDGSLTTTHANSPAEALRRIETLVSLAGVELAPRAVREQLAASVHLVLQQARCADGSRRVTHVCEVAGVDPAGEIGLRPLFEYRRTGTGEGGKVLGHFAASGFLPSFLGDFVRLGLIESGEAYL